MVCHVSKIMGRKKLDVQYDENGNAIKAWRNRNMHLELYPDNDSHIKALELIRESYRYILILHDKDVKEDGTPAKPHYHVLLKFQQARWNTAVAEELGIERRHIVESKDFTHDLRYLVHADNPTKYQYSPEDVEGNLLTLFRKAMDDSIEDERVVKIIDLLNSLAYPVSISEFTVLVCNAGLYSDFRRNSYVFCKMIAEHNSNLTNR